MFPVPTASWFECELADELAGSLRHNIVGEGLVCVARNLNCFHKMCVCLCIS